MNKKVAIGVMIFGIILIIAAVIIRTGKKKTTSEPAKTTMSTTTNNKKTYVLTGEWYSDRENGDTLTLKSDGSYTSSTWLKDGKYNISGETLTLTDLFGKETSLTVTKEGETLTLVYSGGKPSGHSYYRTVAELDAATAVQNALVTEQHALNKSIIMQILTTGDWENQKSFTEPGGYTLHMTDSEYIVFANDKNEQINDPKFKELNPPKKYQYKITEIKQEDPVIGTSYESRYSFKATIIKENGEIEENINFHIDIGHDNFYSIESGAFFYGRQFSKKTRIDFDMQPMANQLSEEPQPVVETDYEDTIFPEKETAVSEDRTVIYADGTVDHIHQIRRNDDPDLSKQWLETMNNTDKILIGSSWKGTFESYPTETTIYWTFDLNSDNTYSHFNGETGASETGTYTISYQKDTTAYYGTIHLTSSEGVQTDYPFFLSDSPDRQDKQLHVEPMEPTYILQK